MPRCALLTLRIGFQIPGPHSPLYNGEYLADSEDVVVVTPKSVF
jgi:hypothetical protein